ncbi:MAG: hypothetical protein GEU90_22545, partial [Gemmatimonas sp.]|nr:hypothetical protein [Gemmatimonas sp.]
MRMRLLFSLCLLVMIPVAASSQTTRVEGIRENSPRLHALVGARVVVASGNEIENATVVVRDGVIEAVGTGTEPPPGARVWDLTGHTLY